MVESFSFCGIDIKNIGLGYVPENKDTYVYAPGESAIHEETFDGHDGGYIYGAYRKPKEFTLRCYYENKNIARGLMTNVHNLFKVGKSGMLVFSRRPWCYYYATVTAVNTEEMFNYMNGLIVVTMKASYPFARGLEVNGKLLSNQPEDLYHGEIMLNTALLDNDNLVPSTSFTNIETTSTEIVLFNPGTEKANVGILMSGNAGDGITIYNRTTDQLCKYVVFETTGNQYIYTDGISGKTIKDTDGLKELAFLYHHSGFIELEPAFPIKRQIYATYNGTTVTTSNHLYSNLLEKEWYTGKHICLNGSWIKIIRCEDEHTLLLAKNSGNGTEKTSIALMNEIIITLSQGSVLTRLSFIYKPTYS